LAEVIAAKLEAGLSARRIYQDLNPLRLRRFKLANKTLYRLIGIAEIVLLPKPQTSHNPFQPVSVISGERICGGSLITFCSVALATKSEFSSPITIDIHLLDPDVDRRMAEFWILVETSGGGGRDSEFCQAS
jgi:hypothetical protein